MQRAALRKSFIPPPDKSFLRLWKEIFLKKIYMNIQTFAFEELRESSSWTSKNDDDTNQKHACWKICKVSELRFVK